MAEYQLFPYFGGPALIIRRLSDGAFILEDENNPDWLTYKAWLRGGNTPQPPPAPERDLAAELDVQAAEIDTLKTRVTDVEQRP